MAADIDIDRLIAIVTGIQLRAELGDRPLAYRVEQAVRKHLAKVPPEPGDVVVDCTVGLGGHSAVLLERVAPSGRLIGIDFDPANLAIARAKLDAVGERFDLFHDNFAALPTVLANAGVEHADGVL